MQIAKFLTLLMLTALPAWQTAWAEAGNAKLTWRELKVGMSEAQARAAMERMGFRMSAARETDAGDGAVVYEVTDPYHPGENCIPKGAQNCTTVSLIIIENSATKRRELAAFRAKIWLGEMALVSKLLDPAVAKYGPPDKHVWEPDHYSKVNISYWRWRWIPVPSDPSVGLTLSIPTFGGEHEPASNEKATSVEISASDGRIFRAVHDLKEQQLKKAPPPVRY